MKISRFVFILQSQDVESRWGAFVKNVTRRKNIFYLWKGREILQNLFFVVKKLPKVFFRLTNSMYKPQN